jgi:hypothetical protein
MHLEFVNYRKFVLNYRNWEYQNMKKIFKLSKFSIHFYSIDATNYKLKWSDFYECIIKSIYLM